MNDLLLGGVTFRDGYDRTKTDTPRWNLLFVPAILHQVPTPLRTIGRCHVSVAPEIPANRPA